MKKIHPAISLAALAVMCAGVGQAQAQDYQLEAGLSYIGIEPDVGPSDSVIGADLTWHFAPVKTEGRPLAEAAFLGRSSNLQLGYAAEDKADIDTINVGGELYLDSFYLAAGYQRVDYDFDESDDFNVALGFLPMDGLLLKVGYAKQDLSDIDTVSLGAKYVTGLTGETAFGLEGGLDIVDDAADSKIVSGRADYYFTPAISAGILAAYNDNDIDNETSAGAAARWFFTPAFSIEGVVTTADSGETWGLRLAGRF